MPSALTCAAEAGAAGGLHPALAGQDACADGLALGAYPGFTPRLALPGSGREGLAAYRAALGHGQGLAGEALIEAALEGGLRGRGGAAFPTGLKLRTVRDRPGPRFVVGNGEEGEPASIKDRWLLRRRPHLVLDGLLRAAEAVGAEAAWLYVSDPLAEESLAAALAEAGPQPLPVHVFKVAPGYVAGEETSLVRALNGGPAKPMDKPPRPFESGIQGRPTFVGNVETLANLAWLARHGPAAYRAVGDGVSAYGTVLLTITGAVARPGLYEVPLGMALGDVLDRLAGLPDGLRGVLMGGYFAGLLDARVRSLSLSYDALRAAGSGLGCGAIVVLGQRDCPVAAAAHVMAYFARENAGQCGACVRGTPAMSKALTALGLGTIGDAELAKLQDWSVSLRGRGACATLDGAAHLAATVFREFPDEVRRHRAELCPCCQAHLPVPGSDTRFRVPDRWRTTP